MHALEKTRQRAACALLGGRGLPQAPCQAAAHTPALCRNWPGSARDVARELPFTEVDRPQLETFPSHPAETSVDSAIAPRVIPESSSFGRNQHVR